VSTRVVDEKVFEYAILQDGQGKIIWNVAQQDRPVVRRKYEDGEIDFIDQKTGNMILPKRDRESEDIPMCTHCGKRPW